MSPIDRAYTALGVSAGATLQEVRRAYRGLVRRWHPDRFANDPVRQVSALEMLKNINEAYELVLADIDDRQSASETRLWAYTAPVAVTPPPPQKTSCSPPSEGAPPLSSPLNPPIEALLSFFTSWKKILIAFILIAVISAGVAMIDRIANRNQLNNAASYDSQGSSGSAGEGRLSGGSLYGTLTGEPLPGRSPRLPSGPVPPRSPYVQAPSVPLVPVAPAAPVAPLASPAK